MNPAQLYIEKAHKFQQLLMPNITIELREHTDEIVEIVSVSGPLNSEAWALHYLTDLADLYKADLLIQNIVERLDTTYEILHFEKVLGGILRKSRHHD